MKTLQIAKRFKSAIVHGAAFSPQRTTMDDFLLHGCELNDSKMLASFEMHKKEFTFGEMNVESRKFAASLLAMGVRPGEKVAVWGPNQPEWLLMKWACAKAGIPMVNVNPLYTARELEYALRKVGAKVLICPKEIGPLNYDGTIRQMIPDLETRDAVDLKLSKLPLLKKIIYYSNTEHIPGTILWKDFENAGDQSHLKVLESIKVSPDDVANIQFTSGTTGMPKAAALSHFNLTNNALAIDLHTNSIRPNMADDSIILNVLPLYHVFSFVAGSLLGALKNIPNIYPAPGFNSLMSIKAIENRKPTHMIGTPTMFTDLINDPALGEYDTSSLRFGLFGGAPVTPALVRQAEEKLSCTVAVGYGMTENSCATFLTPTFSPEHVVCETVGTPIPGVEAKVIGEEEETLNVGELGELCTKGFVIYQGYVDDEEKTKECFTKDGFFKTGDLAVVNPDGTVRIAGRSKDMIIRGGENIQPTEIENFICTNSAVQDCYVVGVPSKRLGEEVAAYVKLKEGQNLTAQDLVTFCQGGLARYKIPKYIKFVDDYPKTVTGKVKKFELQKGALDDFPELRNETE